MTVSAFSLCTLFNSNWYEAVATIVDFADEKGVKHLVDLVRNPGDDPYQSIRGLSLQAVWPNFIHANELFEILVFPGNVISSYHSFLRGKLAQGLDTDSLPYALKWSIEHSVSEDYTLRETVDTILLKAWNYFENEKMLICLHKWLSKGY